MIFFRPDHRQLRSFTWQVSPGAGSALPMFGQGTAVFWTVLQRLRGEPHRTAPPLPRHALRACLQAWPEHLHSQASLCGGVVLDEAFLRTSAKTTWSGGLEDTTLHSDSAFSTFPALAFLASTSPGPRVLAAQLSDWP